MLGPSFSLPRRTPRRIPALHAPGVAFALGVALVLACNDNGYEKDDDQFREDVIWCEEAVARLERCCPSFDAMKIECNYFFSRSEGCSSTTTRRTSPALDEDESRCVIDTSCDALVERGVCERAAAGGDARSSVVTVDHSSSTSGFVGGTSSGMTSGSGTSSQRGPVCP
ncbi:MAG: hypothetical protein KF764_31775 [Labilithrix sp.]|nr:hypothetical protein [Labilithrix sp.]